MENTGHVDVRAFLITILYDKSHLHLANNMKRLLPGKLAKLRRLVTAATRGRSVGGIGWQQQQPTRKLGAQRRTKVTTSSSLSCVSTTNRSKLNAPVQLRSRPVSLAARVLERSIFGMSSDLAYICRNIFLLACAAAAAAATAVVDRSRAGATSWEGRKFEDVYDLAEKAPPLGSGTCYTARPLRGSTPKLHSVRNREASTLYHRHAC